MSHSPALPWEIVETLPTTDSGLLQDWQAQVDEAPDDRSLARALVGRALSRYWAVQEGTTTESWQAVAHERAGDLDRAEVLAESIPGDDDLRAEVLLGRLYAGGGPDLLVRRDPLLADAAALLPGVSDIEIRRRILEWLVLDRFDHGDVAGVVEAVDAFDAVGTADHADGQMASRRSMLWRGNLAMLTGAIDEAISLNQQAISTTAGTAGSPFSFQNVAVVTAIERFFRRGLADLIDPIRSIRASSPRVGVNWDVGLAFSLAEVGNLDEARQLFDAIAPDGFEQVPRDLNWLVTMQLLGLLAVHLDDRPNASVLLEHLRPFAHLDATHGSGYASYGPVGRVVGSLAALTGDMDEAATWFAFVIETRPPGPWTTLTRLDRVQAGLPGCRAADDLADVELAVAELRDWGLDVRAAEATEIALDLRLRSGTSRAANFREGRWQLVHPTGTATVPDSTGIGLLVTLVSRGGTTIPAVELDGRSIGGLPTSSSGLSTLDAEGRAAYRIRLEHLEHRRRPLKATEQDEVAMLRRELAGSAYTAASEPELERARVRVTKAIRRAIDAVTAVSPDLGDHLRTSITTGRDCAYLPADGQRWSVTRS